jgi:hypothetical protein
MNIIKKAGLDLLKGIAAAAASFAGLILGGMITAILGLPTPGLPAHVEMNALMPRLFVTQVVIAIVLGECFGGLYRRYWRRLVSIWVCNYLLSYLVNTLDAMLFSPLPNMSTGIASNIFPALAMAAAIALLWRPGTVEAPTAGIVRDCSSSRKPADWAWRLVLAWLAYPPIYYLMGRAVDPFVHHYYQDPSLGLTLPPSLGVLLAMQVLRGVLFLLAVLPIIVAWRGLRRGLWLWVGAVIYVQVAGQILLQAYWLPVGLRLPHSLELLADSFLQAGVYALLLCLPAKPARSTGSAGSEFVSDH